MPQFAIEQCSLSRWLDVVVCCIFVCYCVGCDKSSDEKAKASPVPPAKTTHSVSETSLNTIELTEDAVRRLGIETQPMAERSMPRFRTYGAEVVLPAGASVVVSAPLSGTLKLQPEQPMLIPGQRIEKDSQVLQLMPMLSPERDVLTPAERIRFAEAKNTIAQSQNDAAAQVQQSEVQIEAAQIALDRAERASDRGRQGASERPRTGSLPALVADDRGKGGDDHGAPNQSGGRERSRPDPPRH